MKKKLSPVLLKPHFDHLENLKEEYYFKMSPYLVSCTYPKNTILKQPGEVALYSYYLFDEDGYIALCEQAPSGRDYKRMVFGPRRVAADFESYQSGQPTVYYLKTLTKVTVFQLAKSDVRSLTREVPESYYLAQQINGMIQHYLVRWSAVCHAGAAKGLGMLMEEFPEIIPHLSQKDLGRIFNTSRKTISRHLQQLYRDHS